MLFRQLFDGLSSTYSYLLADEETRDAVILDAVFEQFGRDTALVRELGLTLRYAVETHVHADHVTAAWRLREALGAKIAVGAATGARGADVYLEDGDVLEFGCHRLLARSTPGHTDGCTTYVLEDEGLAFTGDALLVRGAGRTDFQQGSARALFHSIREKIFSLPDRTLLYPAHDYGGRTVTSVGEERAHNPRIGGDANEGDFVGFMDNLQLPHPKAIDVAVPANMEVGKPTAPLPAAEDDWAPISRSYAGFPEVEPAWVAQHLGEVHLLDVREPKELEGDLGGIEGAQLIPLGSLAERAGEVPQDKPVVIFCRSGRRSAQATKILGKQGIERTASMRGGMIRWNDLRLPGGDAQTGA
ncbi:MAG: MBL fold metallo-hydrolase [Myxococcota bacterium]